MRKMPLRFPIVLLLAVCAAETAPQQIEIVDVGRFNATAGASEDPRLVAEEISGLVRLDGDRYAAVSDEHATLYFLRLTVDPESGRATSLAVDSAIPLRDSLGEVLPEPAFGSDREDLAFDPATGSIWIADEDDGSDISRPSLVRVDPATGRELEKRVPAGDGPFGVYAAIRPNYGFESLARREDGGGYWTANEEALSIDGPLASTDGGSVVRLQELDADLLPLRQLAYVTDPVEGRITSPLPAVGAERCGVSAILALADGRLLVLERELGGDASGMGGIRIRIYLADPAGATDVSRPPYRGGLAGRDFTPATKTLLWGRRFGLPVSNFEAMAFGPRLANGDRSLLLVSDNGGGTWQSVYSLRLRDPPGPRPGP